MWLLINSLFDTTLFSFTHSLPCDNQDGLWPRKDAPCVVLGSHYKLCRLHYQGYLIIITAICTQTLICPSQPPPTTHTHTDTVPSAVYYTVCVRTPKCDLTAVPWSPRFGLAYVGTAGHGTTDLLETRD